MSFAAAAFLAALGALAVPWWLHRREAGHPEQRLVSSLLLMRPSALPQETRKRVQHPWLLALRMLLLAVLTVAFAQPLIERTFGSAPSAEALPRLIAVDTSLSMSGNFDAARSLAHDLVDELPTGARAAVVAVSHDVTVAAPMTAERQELHDAVAGLRVGAGRLAFDGLVGRLTALAGTLAEGPVQVDLISDFQHSAMPGQFNALIDGAAAPLALHRLPAAEDNWFVERIAVDDGVTVTVRGFGTAERLLGVHLEAADGARHHREVLVPAGGRATVTFPLAAPTAGETWLQASVDPGGALGADDVRFHVLRRPLEVPMPTFASPGAGAQVDYLKAAIEAAAPRFRLEAPEQPGTVAVLVDPGAPPGHLIRFLERHLDRGGAVLMTLGPATRRAGRVPLVGETPAHAPPPADPRGVVAVDRRHPVLAGFGDWQGVTVSQHIVTGSSSGRVLLALDDGSPLLVEHRLGAGRLLLLTTALDPAWSTLVATPAFVTFVADTLGYLAEDTLPATAVAGQPLGIPGAGAQLFDQSGRRMLALGQTVAGGALPIEAPGIYTLRTPSRERLLAVNPDPRESDPAPADPALLARWQAATQTLGRPAPGVDGTVEQTLPLAPWLLGVLALLAVLEGVAANSVRPSGAVT